MPRRFQGIPLGYVATSQEAQREAAFYAGHYDHSIPQVDYAYEDTVTDGEIAGLGLLLQPSVGFCNPVLIVTGVDDAIFCTASLASCRTVLDNSRQFFPNSTNFQYAAIPDTGHCLTLHYSAPATFARVHLFLDQVFGISLV
jgi:pimeloyl-ACP methyl ester carboxylesterase